MVKIIIPEKRKIEIVSKLNSELREGDRVLIENVPQYDPPKNVDEKNLFLGKFEKLFKLSPGKIELHFKLGYKMFEPLGSIDEPIPQIKEINDYDYITEAYKINKIIKGLKSIGTIWIGDEEIRAELEKRWDGRGRVYSPLISKLF